MDIFDSVDNAKPSGDVFDAVATGPASQPKGLIPASELRNKFISDESANPADERDAFAKGGQVIHFGQNLPRSTVGIATPADQQYAQSAQAAGSRVAGSFMPALAQKIGGVEQGIGERQIFQHGLLSMAMSDDDANAIAESGKSLYQGADGDARANAPQSFAEEQIAGIAHMLPAVALAAPTGGGSVIADMGLGGFGSKYGALRDAGKTAGEAGGSASTTGAAYAVTSLLPMHTLLKPEMGVVRKALTTSIANTLGMDTADAASLLYDKATVNPNMTLHDALTSIGKTTATGVFQGAAMPFVSKPLEHITGGFKPAAEQAPMTIATARERLQKSKVEIPDTGITDDAVSVDDAIHAANSELDKPTGGEAISASFLDPAMIKAVEQRKGAPLKGELTPEELQRVQANAAPDLVADTPQPLAETEPAIEPEVIPPEAAKPLPETEPLALPATEEVKQIPYRGETAKVPETKEIPDAQISPVAGLPEPVDTLVSPEKAAMESYKGAESLRGELARITGEKVANDIYEKADQRLIDTEGPVRSELMGPGGRGKVFYDEMQKELGKALDDVKAQAADTNSLIGRQLEQKHNADLQRSVDFMHQSDKREANELADVLEQKRVSPEHHQRIADALDNGDHEGVLDAMHEAAANSPDKLRLAPSPKVETPAPVGEKVEPAAKEVTPAPVDTTSATRNVLQQLTSPKRKSDTLVSNLKDAHGKDILNHLAKQEMIRFPGQGRAEVTKAGAKWLEENPAPRTAKQQERYNILSRKKNLTDKDRATLADLERLPEAVKEPAKVTPAAEQPTAQLSVSEDHATKPESTITPEVLSKVTDVLIKALPDKVDIRVVPSIDYSGPGMDEAFEQHGVKSGKVEGIHQAVLTNGELRSIITLSMDGATERTGYHEIMHAAESLRLIKGKDLAILERAYPTKDGVDASERRADAFADYVSKKEQPANSLIRAMFDRIISFTNRLKSALNGEGWRTADDVFKDLMGGKLKGNAETAKPSGPQFSVQKDDKPDLIPISDQFRIVRETADKLNKFADRSKFIKGDVKPTINTAIEGTNVAVDGIRRAVNPMARSDAAEAAGRILIEGMGKMAHDVDKFKGELNKALDQYNERTGLMAKAKDLLTNSTGIIADKVFAALPEKERYDFMQRMDSGEEQAAPELQAIADTVKKMFDEKVEAVQKLGTGALDNARDSYFPHIWERGEDAARQIMAGLSRRPLEGSKGFTKQRVFDDVQAGIDAGYKMVSSNPLDIVFLKMAEMDKYINAHSALQAMEDSGLVQLIPAGEKPHADFSDISGRYGVVTKREAVDPSTGEVNMKSYRYVARDDVAQIFNNYLSQSLYNNKYVGGIYKAYMGAANNLNMFQLGVFSAFHAGFTSHEAVISHASVGMKALSRGDFKTAAKYLAEAPAAWVTNPILGDKIIKAWMGGDAPKEIPQIVQWLELAGARRAMDTRFRTNATQKMMEKWSDKQYTGAVIRTIPAIVEQSARPIMEWLVPRQKFGVFGEMANDWVQRHPNATHEELRENMQKIWNRVDSRLGQVVYDRMFLHNVSKNVAQALIRAPGWTGGTILEVGGGTKDLAKYAKDIAFGKKAEMSDRAAYTVSMLAVTGMMNAMLTAAFTGDSPKDWKDLVAFRTGNLDEQGNPERFMLPTYMKDVYAYASDIQSGEPLRTIGHKTHPLLSLMGDIKKNRDYYGVEIRHEGDNPVHQGAQLAGYVAKAFVPFWLRGLQKEQERGGSALAKTAPFIGVMPAPSDMNKSEAEKLAQKLVVERMPNAAKTKEDFDRNHAMKKLTNSLRKGEPDASDKIRQAVQDGTITLRQAHNIRNNAKLDPLEVAFKRLGYEEAQKVMEVATDEEKERLQKIFKKKERNYKMTHPKSRMQNED